MALLECSHATRDMMAPDRLNTTSLSPLLLIWDVPHYFEAHFQHTQSCDKHVNETCFGFHFRNFPICALQSCPQLHNLWKYVPKALFSQRSFHQMCIISCSKMMDVSFAPFVTASFFWSTFFIYSYLTVYKNYFWASFIHSFIWSLKFP